MELKGAFSDRDDEYYDSKSFKALIIAAVEDIGPLAAPESVAVTRCETTLEEALRAYAEDCFADFDGKDGRADIETVYNLYNTITPAIK